MLVVSAGWGWVECLWDDFSFYGKESVMGSLIGALAEGSPRKPAELAEPAELVELLKPAARLACERERRVGMVGVDDLNAILCLDFHRWRWWILSHSNKIGVHDGTFTRGRFIAVSEIAVSGNRHSVPKVG